VSQWHASLRHRLQTYLVFVKYSGPSETSQMAHSEGVLPSVPYHTTTLAVLDACLSTSCKDASENAVTVFWWTSLPLPMYLVQTFLTSLLRPCFPQASFPSQITSASGAPSTCYSPRAFSSKPSPLPPPPALNLSAQQVSPPLPKLEDKPQPDGSRASSACTGGCGQWAVCPASNSWQWSCCCVNLGQSRQKRSGCSS
jgi:hypothetical protein